MKRTALKDNSYKHTNLFQAAKSAVNGLFYAFKEERNLKIDILVFLVLWCIMLSLNFSVVEKIICCLNWALIVSMEVINTVFERVIDRIWGEDYNEEVKILKDMAAGAVFFLSASLVIIVGALCIVKLGGF
ncbi:diacylglycerol kinase [Xylocopilactobacillus apis]|uniref:Diacylglycerol kinase n=1 Tax=Xylocopilactobacillus apis TaxID=2932183 RepID=A0AAU9DLP5_9LACO|nr:diacylglycerol kinase [Xylocopilactobacillus apis]BDR56509.1 diacylglycerol kinase [Xylocopilactobacillus apis]